MIFFHWVSLVSRVWIYVLVQFAHVTICGRFTKPLTTTWMSEVSNEDEKGRFHHLLKLSDRSVLMRSHMDHNVPRSLLLPP